mmetsp:Transcript_14221/g.39170  ORF Transcript_14221/g.39170 Transcript_14221/m.39170 type:complete len:468 (-) Transcript_14221:81-1484(-)
MMVCGEIAKDKSSVFVLGFPINHSRLETEQLPGQSHKPREVLLWRLRLDHEDVLEGVFFAARCKMWRRAQLLMTQRRLRYVDLARPLVNAEVLLVKLPREVVAIVKHDLPAPHDDGIAADHEVLRQVRNGLGLQHSRVSVGAVFLEQRRAFVEDGERISAGIATVGLVDLTSVIREIVMDLEVNTVPIQRLIVPIGLEAQDLPIVLKELDQLPVRRWLTNLEQRQRLRIDRALRQWQAALFRDLREGVTLLPLIADERFVLCQLDAVLLVEPPREAVAASEVVRNRIDFDVLADAEMARADVTPFCGRDLVPLEELRLRDARVLDLWFEDAQRAILHEIVEDHVPVPAILVPTLDNVFLKEAIKAEYLLVVLEPRRRQARPLHVARRGVHRLIVAGRLVHGRPTPRRILQQTGYGRGLLGSWHRVGRIVHRPIKAKVQRRLPTLETFLRHRCSQRHEARHRARLQHS